MSIGEQLAAELEQEAKTTRRLLERVPEASFGWKPHEKSMSLGQLAGHVAQLPTLIVPAFTQDELDFATAGWKPFNPQTTAELVEQHDANIKAAAETLRGAADEKMGEAWQLKSGDHVLFQMPRVMVSRFVGLNHIVHHRGQLSVYLRLLDVPLPSIYGPSADVAPGA